eukprot:10893212-Ditylum_brightwellii.AAC.1
MYAVEMVEGKDMPKERPVDPTTTEHDNTGGLLLRLTHSLALILLKKVGMFVSALIKKRRYWLFLIPGDAIAFHLKDRQ